MWIRWDELGAPTSEGSYEVRYGGRTICVGVTDREIEQAHDCGGRLRFELKDCTAVMDKLPCYRLGRADRL